MPLSCQLGYHKWKGCTCTACGETKAHRSGRMRMQRVRSVFDCRVVR